jgi:hypothetical protein
MNRLPKRVRRILAVGDPAADGIQRLTRGNTFTCVSGSEEEHRRLSGFCQELTAWLARLGLDLDQISAEELEALLREHVGEDGE